VDDVYTTGSTIKAMIKLAREKGAKKIKVLLMSKTIDLEKRE
jgi:predicted amidophosphoribosyltransferase